MQPGVVAKGGKHVSCGLSEEELCETGPYGTLLHVIIANRKPHEVEELVELFPPHIFSVADEHGQTVLHALAAHGGTEAALESILKHTGAEALAIPSAIGALPLHLAAHKDHQKVDAMVMRMLEETPKASLAHQTEQGANVLHMLAAARPSHFYTSMVSSFIAKVPQESLVQTDIYGRTPLHVAVEYGFPSLIAMLEATPAHVLFTEENMGFIPLELALIRGQLGHTFRDGGTVFVALIEASAKSGMMAARKWRVISPLHMALERCDNEVVAALLACPQATEWARTYDPVTGVLPIHVMVGQSHLFNKVDTRPLLEVMEPQDVALPIKGSGRTALHLAVSGSNLDCGHHLLDKAAAEFDVDALDDTGRSLICLGLMAGSYTSRKPGAVRLLRRLIDMSASRCPLTVANWRNIAGDVDVSLLVAICGQYEPNFFGNTEPGEWEGPFTPLHRACYRLKPSGPQVLADVEESYRRDLIALLELLPQWFVAHSAEHYTPLHLATLRGNAVAVEVLLNSPFGAKAAEIVGVVKFPTPSTPLEVAIEKADVAIVRLFLANVPGIRSLRTAQGSTLAELVAKLHMKDPECYEEVTAAFAPAVKSAVC